VETRERPFSEVTGIGSGFFPTLNQLIIVMELSSMYIASWEITTIFSWRHREGISQEYFIILMEPTRHTSISKGIEPGISSRGALRGFWLRRMLIARSYLDIFILTLYEQVW
jgi:hypothetical protein